MKTLYYCLIYFLAIIGLISLTTPRTEEYRNDRVLDVYNYVLPKMQSKFPRFKTAEGKLDLLIELNRRNK